MSDHRAGDSSTQPPNDPYDHEFVEGIDGHIMKGITDHYFRPELHGFEAMPERGPAILAANHSGNAFPFDGMILDLMLWRREGRPRTGKVRGVFEKQLSVTWWMRLYGINNFWRRAGGIDLTFENFDYLLNQQRRLFYFPEGVPGIGKGFNNRYRLQRFSTSFVVLSARHKAPVYPLHIINAEWSIPFSYTFGPIDRLLQKTLGVPFLPLPAAILGLVFPFAWYFSLPVRMVYVLGEPIDTRDLLQKAGTDPDHPDREVARTVANQIRDQMQEALTALVEKHGKRPYGAFQFLRKMWQAKFRAFKLTPLGWPFSIIGYTRDMSRTPTRNIFHRLVRDWDVLAFYLPFGWPIANLLRHLRKPPCGLRGLSKREKRILQGHYHWNLNTHPLPPLEKHETTQSDPSG